MNSAIEAPASVPPLARLHRRVTGLATVAAAATYLATDAVELVFDFSAAQLWVTFLAFAVFPAAMIGLHALQAGRGGWPSLLGALLYGYAYVYFAATALLAWSHGSEDYAVLVRDLGAIYAAFGVVMVAGGMLFGIAAWRAAVFPRWAAGVLVAGSLWPLAATLGGLPALLNVGGNVLRNLGLLGMGLAALQSDESGRRK
jgi:hypothetical protein